MPTNQPIRDSDLTDNQLLAKTYFQYLSRPWDEWDPFPRRINPNDKISLQYEIARLQHNFFIQAGVSEKRAYAIDKELKKAAIQLLQLT